MNKDRFIEEVTSLGIEVTDKKLEQLEKYYELLIEYNKVMNLTVFYFFYFFACLLSHQM